MEQDAQAEEIASLREAKVCIVTSVVDAVRAKGVGPPSPTGSPFAENGAPQDWIHPCGLQERLCTAWGLVDGLQPAPPVIVHMDGLVMNVGIAGTTPDPSLHPVDRVEVEQEGGPVGSAPPADASLRLDRRGVHERVRVRWVRHGVPGPWSKWTMRVRVWWRHVVRP